MKTIEFNEEQLNDIKELGKELFKDEQDPRSIAYIRNLKRPKIRWLRIIFLMITPIVVLFALFIWLCNIGISKTASCISVVVIGIVYIGLMLKQIVICVVKIYQRYAPTTIRNKCRFEPSCSEYMILAIEKYGLIKGMEKGINRLKRCNINGGGFDLP